MGKLFYSFFLILLALTVLHTGCSPSPVISDVDSTTSDVLLPESSLSRNCPLATTLRNDGVNGGLDIGDRAIDFTLMDIHGEAYKLSGLLKTRPVLMIFGADT